MTTIQQAMTTENAAIANTTFKREAAIINWLEKDIILNVGFAESINRGLITIFIPWPLLFINPYLLLYAAPVMFCLFISALTHFCFIRYAWQHWIKHLPIPAICDFAADLDIPVKTI